MPGDIWNSLVRVVGAVAEFACHVRDDQAAVPVPLLSARGPVLTLRRMSMMSRAHQSRQSAGVLQSAINAGWRTQLSCPQSQDGRVAQFSLSIPTKTYGLPVYQSGWMARESIPLSQEESTS
jgi:hypothetical protein